MLVFLILTSLVSLNVDASCFDCQVLPRTCVSETQFAPCDLESANLSAVEFCPQGSVCLFGTCTSRYEPDCRICDTCNARHGHACISLTTYRFCYGNQQRGPEFSCPEGYVCDASMNRPLHCQPGWVDPAPRVCQRLSPTAMGTTKRSVFFKWLQRK